MKAAALAALIAAALGGALLLWDRERPTAPRDPRAGQPLTLGAAARREIARQCQRDAGAELGGVRGWQGGALDPARNRWGNVVWRGLALHEPDEAGRVGTQVTCDWRDGEVWTLTLK